MGLFPIDQTTMVKKLLSLLLQRSESLVTLSCIHKAFSECLLGEEFTLRHLFTNMYHKFGLKCEYHKFVFEPSSVRFLFSALVLFGRLLKALGTADHRQRDAWEMYHH